MKIHTEAADFRKAMGKQETWPLRQEKHTEINRKTERYKHTERERYKHTERDRETERKKHTERYTKTYRGRESYSCEKCSFKKEGGVERRFL